MGDISWPDNTVGEMLPTPQSLTGKFTYKSPDKFCVYVGQYQPR